MILSWDCSDFRKTIDRIEKAARGSAKEHLAAIKRHVSGSRAKHESARDKSLESHTSIVVVILENAVPGSTKTVTPSQQTQCLEYYSALLAIRDREEITRVLCHQQPDLFSQAIREAVGTFDHMIRTLHEKIDLREHVSAAETFISDFIETSRPKKTPNEISNKSAADLKTSGAQTRAPSIEDYVGLLRRHRQLLYNWLHQVASQCPEIRDEFRAWANSAIRVFRQIHHSPDPTVAEARSNTGMDTQRRGAAGALSSNLQALYTALPREAKASVLAAIDSHAAYLTTLETLSLKRMQHILDDMPGGVLAADDSDASKSSICGPGMFLSRWQQLLDDTVVGPATISGSLRRGKDVKRSLVQGKTVSAAAKDGWDPSVLSKLAERDVPRPPDVSAVLEALGESFRELAMDLLKRKSVDRAE